MSSKIEELAATVSAPLAGHVYQDATSTTTAWLDLDGTVDTNAAYWRNRYLTVQAIGSDVVVALTKTNALALDPTSNQAAGVPPTNGGLQIPAGQERTFFVGPTGSAWRYLAYRAVSTAGRIAIVASSPKELHRMAK